MSDSTQRMASDIDLMTEVAMLYYLENVTQEAIAKRFDLSRAKVSRLLKRARDEGIVEVRVLQHPAMNNELELALVERFQLDRALIAVDHSDPDTQRSAVASLVANYLNKTLGDGMIVAVGMGRNVGAVADNVFLPVTRNCTFVCAIGGSLKAGEYMNPDHICRRLALRFGGESESLY
ncbi:sugar-binding region, partial [Pseudomonas syringae pv. actinidiae ICMP 18804]